MTFEDHFSKRAALYAEYRPLYPDALFEFLAGLTPNHRVALDCGTGSGQAAIGLANHFDRVVATDASAEQIRNASSHPKIEFRVAPADASGLPNRSVDLVTAAQSLHWFEPARFFAEAKRVLVTEGAIAVWGYGDPVLDEEPLHQLLHEFNRGTLESYWAPERQILLDGFRRVEFPFAELDAPPLDLVMHWNLPQLTGYLRTWSAAARYMRELGVDPVTVLENSLTVEWGDPHASRKVRWPLYIRAGRL
ncbi:MAG TPA: class I SAM-dependent methyltransferase [Gemmatimonadaceae bacterium]|nr:class I SAM-dependent methyltransferase [Gemmatimonadaceae bacterium]